MSISFFLTSVMPNCSNTFFLSVSICPFNSSTHFFPNSNLYFSLLLISSFLLFTKSINPSLRVNGLPFNLSCEKSLLICFSKMLLTFLNASNGANSLSLKTGFCSNSFSSIETTFSAISLSFRFRFASLN